jgi:hypothetical protein
MRFVTTCLAIALCGLFTVLVSPAAGQIGDPAPEDPAAGSPSGTIYEIPLDQGRADAAPRHGGSGTAQPSSPIRSQNGFGSSSTVPGASPPSASPAAGGSDGTKDSSKGGSGSDAKKAKSSGSGESGIPPSTVRTQQASGSPSLPRSGALLALGIVLAIAFAGAARAAARR